MWKVSILLISFFILCCECKRVAINPTKIAGGVKAKAGENLDFVLLTIIFQNQAQICGGKSENKVKFFKDFHC